MATEICRYGGYCVRVLAHSGCHTASPSARTLDFDHDHRSSAEQIDDAASLLMLDFPSPKWADLNDA